MKKYKSIFLLCIIVVILGFCIQAYISSEKTITKAIYLVPQNGGLLNKRELKKYPEVNVVNDFSSLKKLFRENTAIWIDKDAIKMVDPKWLHEESQNHAPLVLVGYNNVLYSFREKLSGFGIVGPNVDWSQENLESGFSIWMLKSETNSSTFSFMEGYDLSPSVKQILSITNNLISDKLLE